MGLKLGLSHSGSVRMGCRGRYLDLRGGWSSSWLERSAEWGASWFVL